MPPRRPCWRAFLGMAVALTGWGSARSAHAQAPLPLAADQVSFQVNVCIASVEEGEVDPECASMQQQLPVRFGSFDFQQREEFQLALGQPRDFGLPAGPQLRFRPIAISQSQLQMHVEMPGIVNTLVQLGSGRSVILAGVARSEGKDLIIELRPRFNAPAVPSTRVAEPSRPRRTRAPEVRRVGGRPSSQAR